MFNADTIDVLTVTKCCTVFVFIAEAHFKVVVTFNSDFLMSFIRTDAIYFSVVQI